LIVKRLFVSILLVELLLCGAWIQDAAAQTNGTAEPSDRFVGLDSNSTDIALTAMIEQVVPDHAPGTPAGLYLKLGTPQGTLQVSVGPYLPQDVQQALTSGKTVQVTGKIQNIRGQNFLLARQLVIEGRQVVIRNDEGFLVRPRTRARAHSQSLQNGDLQ
jgi:hypothetical protein